jgi:[ribosomal protein S5]-alanine N-acetyltransferase
MDLHLPPYDPFPTLSAEGILLRDVFPADLKDIIGISRYDGVPAKNVEDAAAMLAKINQNYRDGDSINWGIADVKSNRIIGFCGFYRGFQDGAGELGCILSEPFRGQGYMTAAMRLAIQFGQQNIGLRRIFAITSPQNEKAIRLLDRLGFAKTVDLDDGKVEYVLR